VLCTFAFVLCFYSDAFFSPNSYLFSNSNDGIKNYYTYAYHIKNNKSVTNFEGLNYPYGENFLYTDCHPILVSTLRTLATFFQSVETHAIGILNSLLLLAIILSAYILFLLLRELQVNHFLAFLGAIAITALAPQIFRIQGHFALSYSFAIPLTLLLLLRYLKGIKPQKQLLFLILFNALLLFVHAYLGIICISILVAYFLVEGILTRFKKAKTWKLLFSAGISMVPFLGVKEATDFHKFRTDNPYGFFEYYADVDTILLPNQGPWQEFLFPFLPHFTQTWEGWAYIGLGTVLLLPFIAFHFLKNFNNSLTFSLSKILLASLLLLLFSFGIPFRFGLENVLEYLPFLKQFRSIGRFAWVFYFVISLSAFYLLTVWSEKIESKTGKILLMLSLPLLMLAESLPYHSTIGSDISNVRNSFKKSNLDHELAALIEQINPLEFQAIVSIPFYNIGSENYQKEASTETYLNSMLLSYHTTLPLTSAHSARSSLLESRNAMQFFAPSFYQKAIQKDLPSILPFLVLLAKNEPIENAEKNLLKPVQWIKETVNLSVGLLPYDAVFKNTAQREIDAFTKDSSLVESIGFLLSDSSKYFYTPKFNSDEITVSGKKEQFGSNKSKVINQQEQNKLLELASSTLQTTNRYEASIWVSSNAINQGQDDLNHLEFVVVEKNKNGTPVQSINQKIMSTFVHFEGWSLVQLQFSPLTNNGKFEFYLNGNSPQPNQSFAADLLIRDVGLDVFKILEGNKAKPTVLYKNNHRIKTVN
jgi:hypothetical protein